MPGNLSKKKGLQSTITNEMLDYIAGTLSDTLLNPKIKTFLNLENNYTQTEVYQALKALIDALDTEKADLDRIPSKLSQLENDSSFVIESVVDAVASRVKALEEKDWSDINLDGYQKKLTFDTTPKVNSSNPVTSEGILNAINALKTLLLTEIDNSGSKADQTFSPTSTKPQSGVAIAGELENYVEKVDGKGLSANDYTDSDKAKVALIDGKQDKLTFDTAPTSGSANPVKSGGIYTALSNKANTTALDSYVKKTDYADGSTAGIVKTVDPTVGGNGIKISKGLISVDAATNSEIAARAPKSSPIVPGTINAAVKAALTDSNRITGMTDTEKANARDVIGAEQKTIINTETSTISMVTVNIPYLGNQMTICDHDILTLMIYADSTVPVGYECAFSFQSGETATTISYPGDSFKFVGVDCDADGDFVPSANTNYEVSIRNLSTNTASPLLVARVGVY